MRRLITLHRTNEALQHSGALLGLCAATLLSCFAFCFQSEAAIVFNFANIPGTDINFSGGGFSFTSANGYQFDITSVSGGTGSGVGLNGYISSGTLLGGSFTIGTITTIGEEQTAPVTGAGTLHITDQNNVDLTGTIQWNSITTFGPAGILDLTGSINLTGITYSGVNSDLAALAAAGQAPDVVTFEFVPALTLTQLASTGGSSAYSGVISPVPEPGTLSLSLLGVGGIGLLALARRRKK